jgi:hypothetical protein
MSKKELHSIEIILDFAKNCYQEEVARFQLLEEKTNKLVTFIFVIAVTYSSFLVWLFKQDFPTDHKLVMLLYFFCCLTGVFIINSIIFGFRALKLLEVQKPSLNKHTFNLINETQIEVFKGLFYSYEKSWLQNRDVIKFKENSIEKIYFHLELGTVSVITTLALLFLVIP